MSTVYAEIFSEDAFVARNAKRAAYNATAKPSSTFKNSASRWTYNWWRKLKSLQVFVHFIICDHQKCE